MKTTRTLLFGLLMILVLTPLAQLATVGMTNHDLETSAASGWVFGLLFSIVLVGATLRLFGKKVTGGRRPQMVLLFAMLTIAVPVMNLGLARLIVLNWLPVQYHFLVPGVDTYRRAYQEQDPDWFPIVPTVEGLAYQKADQLFVLLRDNDLRADRQQALNETLIKLRSELKRLERGDEVRDDTVEVVQGGLARMGMAEIERLRQTVSGEDALNALMGDLGLLEPMEARYVALREFSARAAVQLSVHLPDLDERTLYYVPSIQEAKLDRGTRNRLALLADRKPEEIAGVREEAEALEGERLSEIRTLVNQLGTGDLTELRRERMALALERLEALDAEALAEERTEFVYRLRTQERKVLAGREGGGGVPGHDFSALIDGAFGSGDGQSRLKEQGSWANFRMSMDRVSWNIWRRPLLQWGGLSLTLFLFVMCLAELLRRKWVERENLAFPLVEVADHLIRHDFKMETAEDLENPAPRSTRFAPVFWLGFGLGAVFLLVEAFGYYTDGQGAVVAMDVSSTLFSEGPLKELKSVVFVLSPILLGLFFLVNLEISFSVWALYFIFRLLFFAIDSGAQGGIRDPQYVGWASRSFPFEMEQMLGASLCFGILLLVKAFQGKQTAAASPEEGARNRYMPHRLMFAGLMVLPLITYGMMADLGMRHFGLFALLFLVMTLMGVTSARLRAETGLPMQWAHVDFTRLPMMLGMSRVLHVRSFLAYGSLIFLPITLIFRLLPQQLENLELGRRHHLRGSVLALGSFLAFVTALGAGLFSLVVLSHWMGATVLGWGATDQGPHVFGVLSYPMWVQHFLGGDEGLTSFTELHRTRLLFVGVGAGIFGLLTLLRGRFLNFPFHPLGYLLFVFSIFHLWLSPYYKGTSDVNLSGASWLWGSALVAWTIKKLMIKYGGMNTYRASKPAFIGLIVGALFTLFMVNAVDLAVSSRASRPDHKPNDFEKLFIEKPTYTPGVY